MLGGIKVKGEDGAGVPLFRILARRWKSLAPVKRKRVQLAAMSPADEQPEPERKWISKPRRLPVIAPPKRELKRPSWNRWLWMK